MQQKQIDLTDWKRILVGSTDWPFLAEVLVRAMFIYVLIMFAMRLLGRRMSAQLSLFELSMVVTLAASVGVALEVPDRGLLPPIVILTVVILFQRVITRFGLKHRLVERVMAGDEAMLVTDGRILLNALRNSVLSRERVFGALRSQGIQHLGQVERLYLENSGNFSLLRAQNPHPGLSLIPANDPDLRAKSLVTGFFVCERCGGGEESDELPDKKCDHCGSTEWTHAVTELDDD